MLLILSWCELIFLFWFFPNFLQVLSSQFHMFHINSIISNVVIIIFHVTCSRNSRAKKLKTYVNQFAKKGSRSAKLDYSCVAVCTLENWTAPPEQGLQLPANPSNPDAFRQVGRLVFVAAPLSSFAWELAFLGTLELFGLCFQLSKRPD